MKNRGDLEKLLRALGNKNRLAILGHLKKNKGATVTDIASALSMKVSGVSQHLRILTESDIIESKKRGTYVSYRLSLKQSEPTKKVLVLL